MENKIAEYWRHFTTKNNIADATYQTWQFADSAELLANLVLTEEKTATNSAYILYEIEQTPLQQVWGMQYYLKFGQSASVYK
ncbi:hypothetical protein [Aerococcus kribbianus]|uniref:Uncharacterized protein n=1 Tax=Aerococcus kribbianus TaxID=2999064 RepID=A0A9X3FNR5_9LACT|nr:MULTISPECIES: hypothetical protein [unclassified Aerococcus]MCZ0717806.1 hypothetical protein [Aerococcus sp. YH-aer221]MCZ0726093.1 hypothetical protein [Aerococcus sp. YH-aer222]